jgi:hypothetical protein
MLRITRCWAVSNSLSVMALGLIEIIRNFCASNRVTFRTSYPKYSFPAYSAIYQLQRPAVPPRRVAVQFVNPRYTFWIMTIPSTFNVDICSVTIISPKN